MKAQHAFGGITTLVFAASAAVTIVWSMSMSAMGDDDARRLDDVDGVDADARANVGGRRYVLSHVVVMMITMMLPSLLPTLALRRRD
jgi:hypothetical protein